MEAYKERWTKRSRQVERQADWQTEKDGEKEEQTAVRNKERDMGTD